MIIERLRIATPSGGRLQLSKTLASLTGPMAVLPGCIACNVLQSCQNENEFLVELDWSSAEDLIRHLQSDTYKRLLLVMELSPRPPVVQFYAVQEIRGLDLVEQARHAADTERPLMDEAVAFSAKRHPGRKEERNDTAREHR